MSSNGIIAELKSNLQKLRLENAELKKRNEDIMRHQGTELTTIELKKKLQILRLENAELKKRNDVITKHQDVELIIGISTSALVSFLWKRWRW